MVPQSRAQPGDHENGPGGHHRKPVLSHQTSFSIGCYCEDEAHCHRSVLRALLVEKGADVD
jgi:hypothetical protein